MSRIVRLSCAASRSTSTHIAARASGSRPVVGSSRKSTLRPVHEARSRCRAAASCRPSSRARFGRRPRVSPTSSSSSSTRERSGAPAMPVDAALQHEVLAPGRLPVDARVLRDVADRAPHAVRVAHDVFAGDDRAARSRAASASRACGRPSTCRRRSGRAARRPRPRARRTRRRRAPGRPCTACAALRRRSRPRA